MRRGHRRVDWDIFLAIDAIDDATYQTPVYDYGVHVVYQGDDVYVDGKPAATASQYSKQAIELANTSADQPPPEPGSRPNGLPLGVWALAQELRSRQSADLAVGAIEAAGDAQRPAKGDGGNERVINLGQSVRFPRESFTGIWCGAARQLPASSFSDNLPRSQHGATGDPGTSFHK